MIKAKQRVKGRLKITECRENGKDKVNGKVKMVTTFFFPTKQKHFVKHIKVPQGNDLRLSKEGLQNIIQSI